MTATTSNSSLRKQAGASIDAVATEIQQALRQELETLRSSINDRLGTLERALSRDQNDPAFGPAIQKLCEMAAEQVEAASTRARTQAEEAAARQLAAVREKAKAELDTARAKSESTRLELEQRLAQSEGAKVEAALALAEAQRVATAARQDADGRVASLEEARGQLEEARGQIDALERARADLALSRDIAEAHLEGEVHNRNAIAAELEGAREKALHAKADADAIRLQVQRGADRIRVLEERLRQLEENPATLTNEIGAMLGHVRSGLQRLTGATTGRALLDTLLELLAEHFSRVALGAVGPQGLTVWESRGFDPPPKGRKALIALTADSPLTRAAADWKSARAKATGSEEPSGLLGGPIRYAIALPIMEKDSGKVMLYAENVAESSVSDPGPAETIAEILTDHVRQRVRPRGTASAAASPSPSPERQARRVKVKDAINVAVDGAQGTLVDLSVLGAQVLSSRAIQPSRSVRLMLPNDSGGLSCEARVVWVLVEQTPDNHHERYRAGVQFTHVNAPELEAFFSQHGLFGSPTRH